MNRSHGEQGIDDSGLRESLGQLRDLTANWMEVRPVQRVRDRALRLLRIHPLRSADALQLAAALVAAGDDPRRQDFVCSDVRLAAAAKREGFAVL